MKLYDDMPFQRGDTLFGASDKIEEDHGLSLIGREYIHQDREYDTGSWVRVRVCKNTSGIRLVGGKCVTFRVKPRCLHGTLVDGYSVAWMQETAIIDDLLLRGVRPNDLFYVVVSGPCEAYPFDTPISCGDYLHTVPGGDVRSPDLANKSGRLMKADFDHEKVRLARAIMNVAGRSMVDRPIGNDPTDRILIQAGYGAWS